ncbi:odorant-binding protein 84a [Musca autumnalis]|uniref:odorant-binding protein 84a n=1 Tax=Musca autumnalis TaxID=221902 RepID=UPI003CE9306A
MLLYQFAFIIVGVIIIEYSLATVDKAKDNENEYVTTDGASTSRTPSPPIQDANIIDFDGIIALCNSSFSIPMDYYRTFNTTAALPDVVDKTGMCFLRCLYEKSGLLENWKLNENKIRLNMWPATGDSIEVCEMEGANETNPCVRAYDIAKCLTLRALVDARNQPL